MGNQSAIYKNKNELSVNSANSKLSQFDTNFSSEIFSSSSEGARSGGHGPIFVTVNRSNQQDAGRSAFVTPERKTNRTARMHSQTETSDPTAYFTVPTVFRWTGRPASSSVAVSGSFISWKKNFTLSKSDDSTYYTIIDVAPGTHVYKFLLDGSWYHDPNQATLRNAFGTLDNVLEVKKSDSIVIDALLSDEDWCSRRNRNSGSQNSGNQSPPGHYTQRIPQRINSDYNQVPPPFPMYLNESILDVAIPAHMEPSILPHPHHVKLHHLYASSIKDGLICLSVTIRYRSKFITIIMHKSR